MRIHKSHSLTSPRICLWELIDCNDQIWASGSRTDGLTWKKCAAALSAFGHKGLSLTLLSLTIHPSYHQFDQQPVYTIPGTWRDFKCFPVSHSSVWVWDREGSGKVLISQVNSLKLWNQIIGLSAFLPLGRTAVRGDLVKPVSFTLLIHLHCFA